MAEPRLPGTIFACAAWCCDPTRVHGSASRHATRANDCRCRRRAHSTHACMCPCRCPTHIRSAAKTGRVTLGPVNSGTESGAQLISRTRVNVFSRSAQVCPAPVQCRPQHQKGECAVECRPQHLGPVGANRWCPKTVPSNEPVKSRWSRASSATLWHGNHSSPGRSSPR